MKFQVKNASGCRPEETPDSWAGSKQQFAVKTLKPSTEAVLLPGQWFKRSFLSPQWAVPSMSTFVTKRTALHTLLCSFLFNTRHKNVWLYAAA